MSAKHVPHPLLTPRTAAERLAAFLAWTVVAIGAAILVGWWFRIDPLVQLHPRFEPIKANGALCIGLLGVCLALGARRQGRFDWWALLPAGIALATLLQHLTGADFGIDELVAKDHLAPAATPHPGRMAPATAACLAIACLVLTPPFNRRVTSRALTLGMVGSLFLAISGAGIFGFILNIPGGVSAFGATTLSPYGGAIALVVGLALLASAWHIHQTTTDAPPVWLPLPVVIASCALTIILYGGLRERERFYSAITTQNALDGLGQAIHREIETQSTALERVARSWSLLEGTKAIVREADAVTYLGNNPGAEAVAWIASDGRTRWTYPAEGNEDLASLDHDRVPVRAGALLRARDSGLPAVSASLTLKGSQSGFAIYAPILTLGGQSGYVAADFTYARFFAAMHRRLARSFEGYDYAIEVGGEPVFDTRERLARSAPIENALDTVFPIQERRVRVSIAPAGDTADAVTRRRLPEVALVTGFGITLLLGLSVHLARVARAGQRETERANEKLRAEVDEQRRQAEAALRASQLAERKLGLVASRTDNIVVIARPDGAIEWVNDAFNRLFGRALADVAGHPAIDVLAESDPAAALRLREALDTGESLATDLVCLAPGGRQYALSLDLQPIYGADGRLENYILLASDITQRVETERELRRAKIEADAASRAKSDFLASMSHEIRTPMNGVIGMTSLLLHTHLTADQRDSVNTIRQSGETLLTIINDILDFSKIESGRLELETIPLDLAALVEETLDLFSPVATTRGLDLAYRIDPALPAWIEADPTRLRQILANLVNNAVKFTPSGSVSLEINPVGAPSPRGGSAPAFARSIEFRVRDTGIGIAPDRIDRLFKPFSQVDSSTTRKYGGTGLGLVICQRLTQLMGGHIHVESEIGHGSSFIVTIPLRPALAPADAALPPPPPPPRPTTLLLESHPLNRRRLVEQLSAHLGPVVAPADPVELVALLATPGDHALAPALLVIDAAFLASDHDRTLAERLRRLALPILWLHPPGHPPALAEEFGSHAARLARPARTTHILSALRRHLGLESARATVRQPLEVEQLAATIPLSILLVEDNLVNQKVAVRFLDRLGYRADAVANGLEAIRALEARPYDLVFMDLQMPEMDGFEASREIRAKFPPERQPRIVALTANALQGDRESCLAAGMDDYITKPVILGDIAASIQRQFSPPPPA